MTALKVIGIILLIFILIGFLRVGALMQFGDELRVQLSVGPFRFTLLPAKEKKETPKKKAKEKKPKSEGEEAKQKKKPSLPKPTKEELRDLITTALSALKETAKRTCKRLRISLHLRMDYSSEKTHAEGAVGLSLRIRDGLHIALALLIPMLKWYLRYKKAHKNDAPAEKPTESTPQNSEHSEKLTA